MVYIYAINIVYIYTATFVLTMITVLFSTFFDYEWEDLMHEQDVESLGDSSDSFGKRTFSQ